MPFFCQSQQEFEFVDQDASPVVCNGAFSIRNTIRCSARSGDLDLVAGLADQVRDIDHRQRIGAVNFQQVAGLQRLQRLARLQRRQRTFQAGEVECGLCHGANMAKRAGIVNGHRR